MLMELGYHPYTTGVQVQSSVQGYPINGLMVFVTDEALETATYITVRTPLGTLVERIKLDYLHMISDFFGGAANNDTGPGFTYIDLGLCSLADQDELVIIADCNGTPAGDSIGFAAVIDDLPEHDELIYHYQLHNDTSFSSDAASALFLFQASLSTMADLVNVKIGDDTLSTTLRSTNWNANLRGKIEVDNTDMGVVFQEKYGQPIAVNMAVTGVESVVRRIVQVDEVRRRKATERLARQVARKTMKLDAQSLRAIPS